MRTSVDDLRELEDAIFKDDDVPTTAPIIAEDELSQRRKGLHFWKVLDEDRRALLSVVWPWPVACCYVAWQTFDGTAAGVASFRKWRGRIWRDRLRHGQQMKMADAEFALWNALQGGSLKAEAMLGDEVSEIPAGEWPRLKFETNAHDEVIEFDRLLRQGKPRYEEPVLHRIDVMKLWRPLDGWAPDFDAIVDIDPADITPVSDPVALISAQTSTGVSAEKGMEAEVERSKPKAKSKKAKLPEVKGVVATLPTDPPLTRDEVLVKVREILGPRAPGERVIFAVYRLSYPKARRQGDNAATLRKHK